MIHTTSDLMYYSTTNNSNTSRLTAASRAFDLQKGIENVCSKVEPTRRNAASKVTFVHFKPHGNSWQGTTRDFCRFQEFVGTMFEPLSSANKVSGCYLCTGKQNETKQNKTLLDSASFCRIMQLKLNPSCINTTSTHTHTHGHIETSNKSQLKATVPLGAKGKLSHSSFAMPPVFPSPSCRFGAARVAGRLWEWQSQETGLCRWQTA